MVDLLPHIKNHKSVYAFLVGEPQQQRVALEIVLTETGLSCGGWDISVRILKTT